MTPKTMPDTLTQIQKQIQVLFQRPKLTPTDAPDWLKDWYTIKRDEAKSADPQAYTWGLKYLEGVVISQTNPPQPDSTVEVYVTTNPGRIGFKALLDRFFAGISLSVLVTGKFHALAGIGETVSLDAAGDNSGQITLFLKDSQRNPGRYALTCNHVLDTQPPVRVSNHPAVFSGDQIGSLLCRVDIQYANPARPNAVDCALVSLLRPNDWNNKLPGSGALAATASASPGDSVTVINDSKQSAGTIKSVQADLRIFYPEEGEDAYFDGLSAMILNSGQKSVVLGDSGSVAVSATNQAVGMVIAVSDDARTTDNPPVDLGKIIILCDMPKVIQALQDQIQTIVQGTVLSLA